MRTLLAVAVLVLCVAVFYATVPMAADRQLIPDFTGLTFEHADTILFISIPEQYWDPDSSDRHAAIHPWVIKFDQPWNGYLDWMFMSPYDHGDFVHENPCVRVSNDGVNWSVFVGPGGQVCPDPIISREDVVWLDSPILPGADTARYLSDPVGAMQVGYANDTLTVTFRATWHYGFLHEVRTALISTSTANGYEWTPWRFVREPDTIRSYISPATVVSQDGECKHWVVQAPVALDITEPIPNHVEMYSSERPGLPWSFVDTCEFQQDSAFAVDHPVWHLDIVPITDSVLLALLTLLPDYDLYLAISGDGGRVWQVQQTPTLQGTGQPGAFNRRLYKSCGVPEWTGEGLTLGLYYTTWQGTHPDGIAYTEATIPLFVCGDINGDGSGPDIGDLTYLVDYMFRDGPPPDNYSAADVDGSGVVDIADLVYLIDYMFTGGPALQCPE